MLGLGANQLGIHVKQKKAHVDTIRVIQLVQQHIVQVKSVIFFLILADLLILLLKLFENICELP